MSIHQISIDVADLGDSIVAGTPPAAPVITAPGAQSVLWRADLVVEWTCVDDADVHFYVVSMDSGPTFDSPAAHHWRVDVLTATIPEAEFRSGLTYYVRVFAVGDGVGRFGSSQKSDIIQVTYGAPEAAAPGRALISGGATSLDILSMDAGHSALTPGGSTEIRLETAARGCTHTGTVWSVVSGPGIVVGKDLTTATLTVDDPASGYIRVRAAATGSGGEADVAEIEIRVSSDEAHEGTAGAPADHEHSAPGDGGNKVNITGDGAEFTVLVASGSATIQAPTVSITVSGTGQISLNHGSGYILMRPAFFGPGVSEYNIELYSAVGSIRLSEPGGSALKMRSGTLLLAGSGGEGKAIRQLSRYAAYQLRIDYVDGTWEYVDLS